MAEDATFDQQLDRMLAGEPPEVAALVRQLREVVVGAHSGLRERVNPMWHGIAYHHPKAGYLWALFPRNGGVNVGFELGADLPDPHRRLLPGRRTRDIRIEVGAGRDEEEMLVDYFDLALDAALDRAAESKTRR